MNNHAHETKRHTEIIIHVHKSFYILISNRTFISFDKDKQFFVADGTCRLVQCMYIHNLLITSYTITSIAFSRSWILPAELSPHLVNPLPVFTPEGTLGLPSVR